MAYELCLTVLMYLYVCVYVVLGFADSHPQCGHHVSDAGRLAERGPEQHHQADALYHGGLARGPAQTHRPA